MKRTAFLLVTAAMALTAGCGTALKQSVLDETDANIKTIEAAKERRHRVKVVNGLLGDARPIPLTAEPSWLRQTAYVALDAEPFAAAAERVTGGAPNIIHRYSAGLDPTASISLRHSGTVKTGLDALAAAAGYGWSYDQETNTIIWSRFITRTWSINGVPGGRAYLMGNDQNQGTTGAQGMFGGSGTQESTSALASVEYSKITGDISVWRDLENGLKSIVSKEGRYLVSPATTTVTVTDTAEKIAEVDTFLKHINSVQGKQVLIEVQVIEVELSDQYQQGVNLDLIRTKLIGNVDTSFSTDVSNIFSGTIPTGVLAGTISDPDSPAFGSTALIEALETQGRVSITSKPHAIITNNTVGSVRVVSANGYIKNATTVISEGVVEASLEQAIVEDGFTIYMQPHIADNGNIFLNISTNVADLLSIDRKEVGGTAVETPRVTRKEFTISPIIRPGESVLLAGFMQEDASDRKAEPFGLPFLKGQNTQRVKSETILVITAHIVNG